MSTVTATMAVSLDGLMSEKEFLQKIKISRATLNKFKTKRLITHFKAGRRVLYDAQSLEDFKSNCVRRVESRKKN